MTRRYATINDLKLELWLRQRNSDNILWKTKSGQEVSIRNMSDTHLSNTIAMLENYFEMHDHLDCICEVEDAGDRI